MSTNEPYILVFGVSICDIFGFTQRNYRTHESNPGNVKMSFGGVCRNIAENLGRVGTQTKFITVIGEDEKGRSMLEHAKSVNIDMSETLISKDASTPTYMAILDECGEMVSAVVDINVGHYFTEDFVDQRRQTIEGAEYMIFGADQPEITEYILKTYAGKTNFILNPVSAAKAEHLVPLLSYFHTVKPNRNEAEVLVGFEIKSQDDLRKAGTHLLAQGVKKVFISLDADGVYYNDGIEEGIIKTSGVKVLNVTGAGDAFLAGVGYSYMNNLSIVETVKFSQLMSIITISHENTNHPDMSAEYVQQQMSEYEWEVTSFK